MTATSAVVEPDISENNMLNTVTTCERPPRICPTSASDRLATRTTTLRGTHQFADQQKERDGQQRFGIDAVEHLLNDGGERNVGQQARRRIRRPSAERGQERPDIRRTESRTSSNRGRPASSPARLASDARASDGSAGDRLFRRLRMIEAVAATVDDLLDREQRDQRAGRKEWPHRATQSACSTAAGSCRSPRRKLM